jgi:nucleotide-binding universal stress UspA family protein
MFETILLPLDGSALSESALPYAEGIARASRARIVLVRVAQVGGWLASDLSEHELRPAEEAETYLRGIAARLARQGLSVEVVVPYGYAAEMILTEARIRGTGLIVMATHGRTGLGRLLFGSVADKVLRQAELPMLLVPSACERFLAKDCEPRILVTVDASRRSEEILAPVGQLADALGARLMLLEVAEKSPQSRQPGDLRASLLPLETDDAGPLPEQVEGHLERIAGELRAGRRAVEVHALSGEAAATIVAEAQAQEADIIAMATHGRGGLSRLVLGSVATATLKRAGLPMLLVRPTAEREVTTAPEAAGAAV